MFKFLRKKEKIKPITKASEYAKLVEIVNNRPKFVLVYDGKDSVEVASVSNLGGLMFSCQRHYVLTPEEALNFAAWVQDTFSETKPSEEKLKLALRIADNQARIEENFERTDLDSDETGYRRDVLYKKNERLVKEYRELDCDNRETSSQGPVKG